jgi:hypothetical protein
MGNPWIEVELQFRASIVGIEMDLRRGILRPSLAVAKVTLDQGNMSDQIRLDYGSGTVQSDHQPHNDHCSLPLSSVLCPADLPSPSGDNRGIQHLLSDQSASSHFQSPSVFCTRVSVFSNESSAKFHLACIHPPRFF